MRRLTALCVAFALVLLAPVLACGQEAEDEWIEPTGLDFLNAAREAEASGYSMQALFLAGKAAGFSSFVDTTDEEQPPLLDPNTTEYQEAIAIVERNSGYLQWHSEIMANQATSCVCGLGCPTPCLLFVDPNANYIAIISLNGIINIYSYQTGHLLYTIKQPGEDFHAVGFSFDGTMFAVTATEDGINNIYIYIHSENDWRLQAKICINNFNAIPKWSEESNTLVVPQQDFTILTINPLEERLTDMNSGNGMNTIVDFTTNEFFVAYKEDRSSNATYIFNPHNLATLTCLTTEHRLFTFNQTGSLLASWAYGSTCSIWDVDTGALLSTLYSDSRFLRVEWSMDGNRIATSSLDGTICIWDPETGEILQALMATPWRVPEICWAPDGHYILYINQDGFISKWDADNGDLLTSCNGHQGPVRSVDWSPDCEFVVSGGADGIVCLWDVATGGLLHSFHGHRSPVYDIGFSYDGKYIASASSPSEDWLPTEGVLIWDIHDKSLINELDTENSSIWSISWSPNSNYLAASGDNGLLRIFDAISGQVSTDLEGHIEAVTGVTWSPCGNYIASIDLDSNLCVWKQPEGILMNTREIPCVQPWHVSWSPDGQFIAVADTMNNIFIYDKDLNLYQNITIHNDKYCEHHTIVWSSDSARLAIGGRSDLQIWDVNTHSHLATYINEVGFGSFSLSTDGEHVVTGGMGLSMWDLTGHSQGKFNADILRFIEFDGTEVRFIHPLGNIGEVLSIHRQ